MNNQFFDKKLGKIPEEVLHNALIKANRKKQLEEAALNYILKPEYRDLSGYNGVSLSHDDKKGISLFIAGATHVQETELKEARELIEELKNELKDIYTAYYTGVDLEIETLITKAETFLNK